MHYDDMNGSDDVTFKAFIREFSNTSLHKPGQAADYIISSNEALSLRVFANGIDSGNEGYVSVLVKSRNSSYFCLLCFVGVIDASAEKRFLRSFSFPVESGNQGCLIEQYIKRETLLGERLDLLPNDCLTLYVSVNFVIRFDLLPKSDFNVHSRCMVKVFEGFRRRNFEKGMHFLSLDTELFEKLKDASSYFQRMSETAMIERSTRLMYIPDEEYKTFKTVCCILLGSPIIPVTSIEEICSIYIISEKYLLSVVTAYCREMFIALLRSYNFYIKAMLHRSKQQIYQLAETYNDDILVKVVESFRSKRTEISNNIDLTSFLNTKWHVYFDKKKAKLSSRIYFLNRGYYFMKRIEKREDIEYNFYQ